MCARACTCVYIGPTCVDIVRACMRTRVRINNNAVGSLGYVF